MCLRVINYKILTGVQFSVGDNMHHRHISADPARLTRLVHPRFVQGPKGAIKPSTLIKK